MAGRLLVAILALAASPILAQNPPRFTDRVNVARVLIDARAISHRGQPLLGLTPGNFEVRIDGKPTRVESAQWVAGALAAGELERDGRTGPAHGSAAPLVEGRLVVFLFQKSLDASRIGGLMRTLLDSRTFLDGFTTHDRLAVVSFDSRLRLWLDFTSDLDRVRQVLARNLLFGGTPPEPTAEGPSLFDVLGGNAGAGRASDMVSALRLLATGLQPLPGAKSVVLVGHGFGRLGLDRLGFGQVLLENDYDDAAQALRDARASVFCLDVTNADYHSLEAGLEIVAADTGGFFERTHQFGRRALERLGAALAGHYVLIVEKPEGKPGDHRIDVRLIGRDGIVFARNAFAD